MLSLKLLGGVSLVRADAPVRGRASHTRRLALLAMLATARHRTVSRERLIGVLWPEHRGDAARRLLSESLYVLRKEMGEDAFVVAGDEVGLSAGALRCDLWEFEAAIDGHEPERAAAGYPGVFLDGFYVSGAPEFERWAEGQRDRIARAYAAALEALAEAAEIQGDPLRAASWWRRLCAVDPASSRLTLRLMGALEAGGEHAAAIRHAQSHARYMRDEIGVEPAPEVMRESERLRREPPAGTVRSPRQAAEPAPSPTAADAADPRGDGLPVPGVEVSGPAAPRPAGAWAADDRPPTRDRPAVSLPANTGRRRWRGWSSRRTWAVAAGASVALAVAGGVALASRGGARGGGLDPRRIAVLYLDDMSERRDAGYLADGLTESLIHDLGQARGLHVISRNGVKPYRARSVPLDSIVQALRAGSLVEGSVQKSGGRVRVTVQLIDGATGTQLQSRTIERSAGELFALEDELTREVSRFLRARLGQEIGVRESASTTRVSEARDRFLRAERLRTDASRASAAVSPLDADAARTMLARADSLLQAAAQADPRWPEPEIGRGWVRLEVAGLAMGAPSVGPLQDAIAHASRALSMRPGDPGALELRGTARWRMVHLGPVLPAAVSDTLALGAERDLKAALTADPSLAGAWSTLSQLLRLRGNLAEADLAARRALQEDEYLDDAPVIIERLYRSSFTLGRYAQAADWCARGRRQYPDDWRFVECRLTLLGYAHERPDVPMAEQLELELQQLDPPEKAIGDGRRYSPIYRRMAVARVMARAGMVDSARAVIAWARKEVGADPDLRSSLAYDEAYVRLLTGDRQGAIQRLKEYVDAKPILRDYVARDIQFRALWHDPRFVAAISRSARPFGRSANRRSP